MCRAVAPALSLPRIFRRGSILPAAEETQEAKTGVHKSGERKSTFRAFAQLSVGQVATQSSSFLRNLVLARLISPADFGIAATLGISLQVIEMLTNVSSQMLLVQASDGDRTHLQGTAQMLAALRGIGNGALIFLLAWPAALLFGVPHAVWAFRSLGLLPVLRGFYHLDASRLQRHFRFGPSVIADAGANWCGTLIGIPLAWWLRSYAAMVWILLIQAATATIISHVLAERPYHWSWDRTCWRRIVSFGWPLMINGILMFGIFEGDRLVIGSAGRLFPHSHYSLADLGTYSIAFSITMAPSLFISNLGNSLFLPLLSRVQMARELFRERYNECCHLICLAAGFLAVGFTTIGTPFLTMVYGSRYARGGIVICWLGSMWALRAIRVAPIMAAMALGDTKNAMVANIARSLAIFGMIAAAATGAGLQWIAISGLGGELLAVCVSLWRLQLRQGISPRECATPLGIAIVAVAMGAMTGGQAGTSLTYSLLSWVICSAALITGIVLSSKTLPVWLASTLDRYRKNLSVEA